VHPPIAPLKTPGLIHTAVPPRGRAGRPGGRGKSKPPG
jgi:hypothetical protein